MSGERTSGDESRALSAAALDATAVTSRRRGVKVKFRPTQDVAERLSSTAIRLFAERGFDAVSVGDIAAGADVTPRTFFRYYPNKETVLIDVFDRTNDRLMQIIQVVRPGAEVVDTLRAAVVQWFDEYDDLFSAVTRMTEASPPLMSAFLLRTAAWEVHLAEALRARYPDLDADDATVWAVSSFTLLRLSQHFAQRRRTTFAQGAVEAFGRFDRLAGVFHHGYDGGRSDGSAPNVGAG